MIYLKTKISLNLHVIQDIYDVLKRKLNKLSAYWKSQPKVLNLVMHDLKFVSRTRFQTGMQNSP